jgi:hypothetical protein
MKQSSIWFTVIFQKAAKARPFSGGDVDSDQEATKNAPVFGKLAQFVRINHPDFTV